MKKEESKTAHYEFLRLITELTKLKADGSNNSNDADIHLLKKQINEMSSNPLGAKNWLIEKAKLLK